MTTKKIAKYRGLTESSTPDEYFRIGQMEGCCEYDSSPDDLPNQTPEARAALIAGFWEGQERRAYLQYSAVRVYALEIPSGYTGAEDVQVLHSVWDSEEKARAYGESNFGKLNRDFWISPVVLNCP